VKPARSGDVLGSRSVILAVSQIASEFVVGRSGNASNYRIEEHELRVQAVIPWLRSSVKSRQTVDGRNWMHNR
jgi:hypothetical protein